MRGKLIEARKAFRDLKEKCKNEYTDKEIAGQVLSQSAHDIRCLDHMRGCLSKARKENRGLLVKISALESK